ncbi:hypothetical protein Stsp02_04530 [Streptomyces sp. NBRC 14336]|uniref:DUF397 domain-containing protein n=1 Tax=Streptomyces sp. NBRC 14336 TaxID=3030992 RepID=UPI0024A2F617|nr:DUF397 domain-containing protein [Streptomyces sp. NBRC 14336]WBO80085.1 DUF397 domain-containing protein [Streptomyces sp. SBE_14.2]GLW44791.1 hypothetical protein Stsp02_04530 [Streptomyces sp. NBRC 14336]
MSIETLHWFKSSYSSGEGGQCLEVAVASSTVHLRDSKTPESPYVTVGSSAWNAFLQALK